MAKRPDPAASAAQTEPPAAEAAKANLQPPATGNDGAGPDTGEGAAATSPATAAQSDLQSDPDPQLTETVGTPPELAVTVLSFLQHDGKDYAPGETLTMPYKDAVALLALGCVAAPPI